MASHDGEADDLPPPPPLDAGVEPLKTDETKAPFNPVQRNGFGRKGQRIKLLTNHFKVSLMNVADYFYQYNVNLKYEDDKQVVGKGLGRKVIKELQQTYAAELGNKDFAYDGEESPFTIGALPQIRNEFTVFVDDISTGKTPANGSPGNDSPPGSDRKRIRRPYNTKTYKIELCTAKIPMSAISQALRGQESEHTQEATHSGSNSSD